MKWLLEITPGAQYPLHIYYANDERSKIVGYIVQGTKELKKFSSPLPIVIRGRKFRELKVYAEDDSAYFESHSKQVNTSLVIGRVRDYTISKIGDKVTCTCPGYQFRRNCKHVREFN